MKKSILILNVIIFITLVSCGTIDFKTTSIVQPITLNNKLGPNGVELPKQAVNLSNVSGYVLYSKSESPTKVTTTEKANADVDFINCVQTLPNHCVTNLTFTVRSYMHFMGIATTAQINYEGDCNEIKK